MVRDGGAWVLRERVSRETLAAGKQITDGYQPPDSGRDRAIAMELGRNPVSKHQIQPEYGDEQADAGVDG